MLLAPGITQMLWPQYTTHGYFLSPVNYGYIACLAYVE